MLIMLTLKLMTLNNIDKVNQDFREIFGNGFSEKYMRTTEGKGYNLNVNFTE